KGGKTTTSEGTLNAVLLAEILREREETSSEETILREIFKASITRTTIDITVIESCLQLSALYERQGRWSETIDVCLKSLNRTWSSLVAFVQHSETGVWALPKYHYKELLLLAHRLATCYRHEGKIIEAENVYVFMLTASRASLRIQDETILMVA